LESFESFERPETPLLCGVLLRLREGVMLLLRDGVMLRLYGIKICDAEFLDLFIDVDFFDLGLLLDFPAFPVRLNCAVLKMLY